MYPMCKKDVTYSIITSEDSGMDRYFIINGAGEEFEISKILCEALIKADGKHPLDLPDEGKEILPILKEHDLIQTSRFCRCAGKYNYFTVFFDSSTLKSKRDLCKKINAVLPALALLTFAIGEYMKISAGTKDDGEAIIWLYFGLIFLSFILHEVGHLIAGIAYGYGIGESGILFWRFLPAGAYVAWKEKENSTKCERIQFSLAGIEMDIMFAGILLIAAVLYPPISTTTILVAKIIILISGINLMGSDGTDGEQALSAVCGVKSINKLSKEWLGSKKRRRKLLSYGFTEYVCFIFFALVLLSAPLLSLSVLIGVGREIAVTILEILKCI